jgi:NitT/TauT family transport system permease protein
MKKTEKNKLTNLSISILTVLGILIFWTVLALIADSSYILPSIPETVVAIGELLITGEFYISFLLTLLRSVIAFALSFSVAFLLSLLCYKKKTADRIISPIVGILRALPTVAVILLLLIWTNSEVAPVIVTMLVVLPTLKTEITNALNTLDDDVITMCKVFGVSKREVFKKVTVPQVLPALLLSAGAGLSLNVKLMVAAEVLASTKNSIGNMLNFANFNLLVPRMLALVTLSVIACLVIEKAFKLISKKVGKWQ